MTSQHSFPWWGWFFLSFVLISNSVGAKPLSPEREAAFTQMISDFDESPSLEKFVLQKAWLFNDENFDFLISLTKKYQQEKKARVLKLSENRYSFFVDKKSSQKTTLQIEEKSFSLNGERFIFERTTRISSLWGDIRARFQSKSNATARNSRHHAASLHSQAGLFPVLLFPWTPLLQLFKKETTAHGNPAILGLVLGPLLAVAAGSLYAYSLEDNHELAMLKREWEVALKDDPKTQQGQRAAKSILDLCLRLGTQFSSKNENESLRRTQEECRNLKISISQALPDLNNNPVSPAGGTQTATQ